MEGRASNVPGAMVVFPLDVPFWNCETDKVREMQFRFANQYSQCPTWWGLTALNYHYETQCIPTPLAWFVHQLPEWFQVEYPLFY